MPHPASAFFQPPFIAAANMTAGHVEAGVMLTLRVSRVGAAIASTLILLAPAIWNRFPLLQYDTGGYLVRWFEGYLVPSRSTVFGLYPQHLRRILISGRWSCSRPR